MGIKQYVNKLLSYLKIHFLNNLPKIIKINNLLYKCLYLIFQFINLYYSRNVENV